MEWLKALMHREEVKLGSINNPSQEVCSTEEKGNETMAREMVWFWFGLVLRWEML